MTVSCVTGKKSNTLLFKRSETTSIQRTNCPKTRTAKHWSTNTKTYTCTDEL